MRQKEFETIGKTGCYFLSIVHLAEKYTGKYIDAYLAYTSALKSKVMKEDCFVLDPAALLRMLTGVAWSVTKEAATYEPTKNDLVILYYERIDDSTMESKVYGHFVVGGNDGVEYDPYGDSLTVRKGTLKSKRIFRRA